MNCTGRAHHLNIKYTLKYNSIYTVCLCACAVLYRYDKIFQITIIKAAVMMTMIVLMMMMTMMRKVIADEKQTKLIFLRNWKMSDGTISFELAETSETQVHPFTVHRNLARSGLCGRVAAKKP